LSVQFNLVTSLWTRFYAT